jgi:DNA-binding NarL/FixJ family response regulator
MLRLAIVDDHRIVRAGFREMLADELGLREFEAASGEEALQKLREQPCDVLLLDLSLPGASGVDVLRAVRQRYAALKVLVLSGFPEERYALPMIRNGANGYLCKDCERDELIRAIRTVAQGRRYVSPRTAELLADDLAGVSAALPHESLSERELQVFLRLAKGDRCRASPTRSSSVSRR